MTGLYVPHVRDHVLVPAMRALGGPQDSPAARQLMLFTAIHESGRLKYLRQHPRGPARGLLQVEGATSDDVWRYLRQDRNAELRRRFNVANGLDPDHVQPIPLGRLVYDLRYCFLVARVRYWYVPESLPEFNDKAGMVRYWSIYYQTTGDPEKERQAARKWELHRTELESDQLLVA